MDRLLRFALVLAVLSLGLEGVDRALLARGMGALRPPNTLNLYRGFFVAPSLPMPPPPPPPTEADGGVP